MNEKKCFFLQGNELGFAGQRIENCFKKYTPENIKFVTSFDEADFCIIHHQYKWDLDYFKENFNKKPLIFIISEIYTDKEYLNNFFAQDNLKLIWTFHPLDKLGYDTKGKFLRKPMGVDTDLFHLDYETVSKARRPNQIICFNAYDSENHEAIYNAVKMTDSKMIHLAFHYQDYMRKGKVFDLNNHWMPNKFVSDEEVQKHYLTCKYVSGLRSACGFEVTILEGLLSGCRPIIFDNIYYTDWFKDFAVTIPEEYHVDLSLNLVNVFKSKLNPVKEEEMNYIRDTFSWRTIIKDFWHEVGQRL